MSIHCGQGNLSVVIDILFIMQGNMATVQQRIDNWRKSMLRWASQVNNEVALLRYNKWLQIFQKELLEYVANQGQTTSVALPTEAGRDTYALPFNFDIKGTPSNPFPTDFYSIIQLRVAYEEKNGTPIYRVCEPISLTDYNIKSNWYQKGKPYIWGRISKRNPRYAFINTYDGGKVQTHIRIFPTPDKTINPGWISLNFNYINKPITDSWTDEGMLGLPRYFLDVIDDYMSYRLIEAENPELAGSYYQTFINTLHNNIYGLNRDQRPVEEEFANLRWLSHN